MTADKDISIETTSPEEAEKKPSEVHAVNPAVKPSEKTKSLKSEQCDHEASCKAILKMHTLLEACHT